MPIIDKLKENALKLKKQIVLKNMNSLSSGCNAQNIVNTVFVIIYQSKA